MGFTIKLFDDGFKKCFLFLLTSSLLIIWLPRYLPLTDYPEHLLVANILSRYDDPAYGYYENFSIKINNSPYLVFYVFAKLLSHFLPIQIIGKIFISLYIILTPISVLYYITSFDRDSRWSAIVAVPLAFNIFYFAGFINFIFSIPLIFFSLGALVRNLDDGFVLPRSISIAFLNILAFYSHICSFAILVICESVLLLVKRLQGNRKAFLNLFFILPSLIPLIMWWLQTQLNDQAINISWEPLRSRLLYLLQPFLIYRDWKSLKMLVDVPYALFITGITSAACYSLLRKATTSSPLAKSYPFPVMFSGIFALGTLAAPSVLFLPSSFGITIAHRYSIYIIFSLLALLPKSIAENSLLKLALFAMSLGLIINLGYKSFVFDHEMGVFDRIVERMSPRSSVLPLIINMHSSGFKTFPYLHIVCYYHLRKGGKGPYMHLLSYEHFPVQYKDDRKYHIPNEADGESFDWSQHDHDFDYFIVKGDSLKVLSQLAGNTKLIFHEADWYLFKRR